MKLKYLFTILSLLLFAVFFMDALLIEGAVWKERRSVSTTKDVSTIEMIRQTCSNSEDELNSHFHLRYPFYDVGGIVNRLTNQRMIDNFLRLDNGHLVTRRREVDIGSSLDGLKALSTLCNKKGIPLIYVNVPHKPLSDQDTEELGFSSFASRNADLFLKEAGAAGIETIDLRKALSNHYEDPYDAYYKTDHHWKPSTGLYCAQVLASELKNRLNIPINPDQITDDHFDKLVYKDFWVGEFGKKAGATYTSPEDFELITPSEETRFHIEIPKRNLNQDGDFSLMLNKSLLQLPSIERRYGSSMYYTYLYGNDDLQILQNKDQNSGTILIIKDSYAQTVNPFLAMTVKELVCWDVRNNNRSLTDYINNHQFDAVIVMYSETMLDREIDGKFMFDFS